MKVPTESLLCTYIPTYLFTYVGRSHMSRALDRTEKSTVQKLGHPMLVQAILSQKNQKSKFFNEPFFRNPPISIFPYTKLEAKWRKNGSLCAVNCLNLFKIALNSLWTRSGMCQRLWESHVVHFNAIMCSKYDFSTIFCYLIVKLLKWPLLP